jgi:hypothetical protein
VTLSFGKPSNAATASTAFCGVCVGAQISTLSPLN